MRPPRTIASLISTELVVARETASTLTGAALDPGAERCEKLPGPRTEERKLADDVDTLVEVVALVVFNKWMKQLILDTEYADRLRMMNKPCRSDMACQINTNQKD